MQPTHHRMIGFRGLYSALLLRSILDIIHGENALKRKDGKLSANQKWVVNRRLRNYYDAKHWLFSDNEGHVNDFLTVCGLCGLDAAKVRKAVKEGLKKPKLNGMQWS